MDKELKLILSKLKIVSEVQENGLYLCDKENSKLLLDYITNLQQENEILKQNAENNDKVVDKANWEKMIYKSRCEKAVEYITINCITSDKWEDLGFYNFVPTGKITYRQLSKNKINKLLNILNGKE